MFLNTRTPFPNEVFYRIPWSPPLTVVLCGSGPLPFSPLRSLPQWPLKCFWGTQVENQQRSWMSGTQASRWTSGTSGSLISFFSECRWKVELSAHLFILFITIQFGRGALFFITVEMSHFTFKNSSTSFKCFTFLWKCMTGTFVTNWVKDTHFTLGRIWVFIIILKITLVILWISHMF